MANEIVKHQEQSMSALAAITPRNYEDVSRLAMAVAKSGLYNVRGPDDAFVRIVTGIELGIGPMQALRTISVVSGKPVMDASLIAALCMRHTECEHWRVVETTDARCTIETKHTRNGVTRLTYTIEQAKLAGLTGKDNWKHYPSAMLRAPCTSALARIAYHDVVSGFYVPDEMGAPEPRQSQPELVVDAEPEPQRAAPYVAAIIDAATLADLSAVGVAVKADSALTGADRGIIREAYAAKQRELKAGAKRPSAPRSVAPPEGAGDAWEPETVNAETGEVA